MNFLAFFFAKWYNSVEGSDFLLSDNIRKYRKSKHMSQDELAEKLEVTRQSISLWETGQTQPSLDNIIALAKLFDVSTDSLTLFAAFETPSDIFLKNSAIFITS